MKLPNILRRQLFLLVCLSCVRAIEQKSKIETAIGEVVVEIEYGRLVGKRLRLNLTGLEEKVTDVIDRFYGVPFAKPPVGKLRFSPPEAPEKWQGEREAFKKGPSCPQSSFPDDMIWLDDQQNEDCLFLNVFTPFEASDLKVKYPVILFIHGGSYESGTGNMYDGSVLASFGVVVVTFNYRLGALGFLVSGDHHMSGNYGLKDQLMVMKWIQRNIASFRGDPGNVMLVGHSVGAALVGTHMTIEESKGLFHSAVAQSGSASASYGLYHDQMGINFKEYIFNVSNMLGCGHDGKGNEDHRGIVYEGDLYHERMARVVECLRKVKVDKFIQMRSNFPLFDKLGVEFRPYLDGVLIKRTIHEAIMEGHYHKVPLITGVVEKEFDFFMEGFFNKTEVDTIMEMYLYKDFANDKKIVDLLRFYYIDWPATLGIEQQKYLDMKYQKSGALLQPNTDLANGVVYYKNSQMLTDINMEIPTLQMADIVSIHSPQVYFYYFCDPQSYHSIELSYLFGTPFGADPGDDQQKIKFDPEASDDSPAKNLSKTLMSTWTYFAKNKKVPLLNGVEWPKYDSQTRRYMNFSLSGTEVFSHLSIEKTFFWNELIPNLFPKTSLNALGPGGSILKKYPSQVEAGADEPMQAGDGHPDNFSHILITLLVFAVILILLLIGIIYKLKIKTSRLEKISKLYSSEHATNL